MKQISLKEICYYLFFGLLFAAKGIGLYDGQSVFKIILVAALFFWVGKMLLTSYSIKEILAMGVLLMLGVLSYYYSSDKSALIAAMVITGMKDIPIKRLFKIGLVIWTIAFVGTVTASLLGLKGTAQFVHNKGILGFVIRDALGLTHPNVLHISYIVLIALWFLVFDFKGKNLLKAVAVSLAGSVFIFLYSLSYTGFMFMIAYLILVVYLNLRPLRTKAENIIIQCLMHACVAFSILGPITLKGKLFDLVNKAVNTRFELSRHYLTTLRPELFGTRVSVEGNYTIDCSYVHCLYYYGVILFVLMIIGFFLVIRHLLLQKRNQELAMVLGLIAAGFTEPFLFNFSFKNLIFPLLGELLFIYLATECRASLLNKEIRICRKELVYEIKEIPVLHELPGKLSEVLKKSKKQILAGALSGLLLGVLLGNMVSVEPYVVVNKNTSDRVGKKGDYQIYGELSEEIKDNSLQVNVHGDDTKVFVLSGSITEYQEFRQKVTVCIYSLGVVLIAEAAVLFALQNRKKDDKDINAG